MNGKEFMIGTNLKIIRHNRKRIVFLTLLAALFLSIYPFEITVLPVWTVVVINDNGEPMEGVRVVQSWKHYSYEEDLNNHLDERLSAENGSVTFPARKIKVNLLTLLQSYVEEHIFWINIHGSAGMHAYIYTNEPNNFRTLSYEPGKPLPDKLLVTNS